MDYSILTGPIELDGCDPECVKYALGRAEQAINKIADAPGELRAFLEAEAEEAARRADYHNSLGWFYHENVGLCDEAEAKAFEVMIDRFDNMV